MTSDMLSPHFTRKEMCCPHCQQCLIEPALLDALEALRALGPEPIIVHSAYRCGAHNNAVGGMPHSEHVLGQAADIEIHGLTVQQQYDRAKSIPAINGIGVYPEGFIHVDVRKTEARAVWSRVKGDYRPISELVTA